MPFSWRSRRIQPPTPTTRARFCSAAVVRWIWHRQEKSGDALEGLGALREHADDVLVVDFLKLRVELGGHVHTTVSRANRCELRGRATRRSPQQDPTRINEQICEKGARAASYTQSLAPAVALQAMTAREPALQWLPYALLPAKRRAHCRHAHNSQKSMIISWERARRWHMPLEEREKSGRWSPRAS